MRAIVIDRPGGPEVLIERQVPDPTPTAHQVLIRVAAAGVNRADVGQRRGAYPPPAGAPDWPGMEVSGTIAEVGDQVERLSVGDEVCALLPGGGYAELAVAHESEVLLKPAAVSLVDAAALPETIATVWSNLVMVGRMRTGDSVLIHGGSSGIGTTGIQIAHALGCRVLVTAGSPEKLAACAALGADVLIDYRREDFVARVADATDGAGVDLVLDSIGGDYLARDIQCLSPHGRVLVIGNQSGAPATIDTSALMRKWASVHGSTLRARTLEEKADIVHAVEENVWPLVESGLVLPVIDTRFPLADAPVAHERMESSAHIGKLLLVP